MRTAIETGAVTGAFGADAGDYDRARRQLIPCFDGFYGAALAALPFGPGEAPAILDLGAGTGLLSAMIRAALPAARLTVTDGSEAMLARARERFADERLAGAEACEIRRLDFAGDPLGGPWDAVVSALAIHHLEDAAKQALYGRILEALAPGGVFVNAEQVLGGSEAEERDFALDWLLRVKAAGVSSRDLAAAQARMAHDRCAPLARQLDWLRRLGFAEASCAFQDKRFAVILARKAG